MMDDIRLVELAFLQRITDLTNTGHSGSFYANHEHWRSLGLMQQHFIEMVINLSESGAVRFREERMQLLVALLRHEYHGDGNGTFPHHEWENPRRALELSLLSANAYTLAITYTGLRRIEDLRDQLKQDRVLDPLGVLLDWRYFLPELRLAFSRSDSIPVSVIALDLDGFKAVNDLHGHDAGDAVLRSYMNTVKDIVGITGTAFRRGGDEVHVLLPGSDRDQSRRLADSILHGVRSMKVQFKGKDLPRVSSSIGVASSPPDSRSPDLDGIADQRQLAAKKAGKDRVVDEG